MGEGAWGSLLHRLVYIKIVERDCARILLMVMASVAFSLTNLSNVPSLRVHHQIRPLQTADNDFNYRGLTRNNVDTDKPATSSRLTMSVFVEAGKPEEPWKNPQNQAITNNKLNAHETTRTGLEPGSQRWETRAYPLRHPCSQDSWVDRVSFSINHLGPYTGAHHCFFSSKSLCCTLSLK